MSYSNKFIHESHYFLVHYFNMDMKKLHIETIVYIGKNLEDDDEDLWFFQDVESFYETGIYDPDSNSDLELTSVPMTGKVYDFPESQLDTIYSVDELPNVIREYTNN